MKKEQRLSQLKIKRVLILAGGLGTRFLPATKALAKEMLPIVDKPCIQYLVEEAVLSGINEIIIVTGNGKESIEQYFGHSKELFEALKKRGDKGRIRDLEKIEKMAKIKFIKQPKPKGDGDAILCAKRFLLNEPFAVLFGDDIYDSKVPALKQMIKIYEKTNSPVIALQKVNLAETEKYGIAKINSKNSITQLVEKPSPQNAPSNLAITGKYILTPNLLNALAKSRPKSKDKELRLIDGMIDYIATGGAIFGCEIDGIRFDTGDKLGYLKAVIHFALKHKDLGRQLECYLGGIELKGKKEYNDLIYKNKNKKNAERKGAPTNRGGGQKKERRKTP